MALEWRLLCVFPCAVDSIMFGVCDMLFATLSGGYVQCWLCGEGWCVVVIVFQ